jgi:hyaluronoglucosaminidase
MFGLGIIEGFFGPEWSWRKRESICELIANSQKAVSSSSESRGFYIYAPKRDPYLRKEWSLPHPPEMWRELIQLREKCDRLGVDFGVGLSPFEIHHDWNEKSRARLTEKLLLLENLRLDVLGIFFDDMKGSPDLAEKQIEILAFIREKTRTRLLFCPTYYSLDPILDRVFGQRPENYLETLGRHLPVDIDILWTGSKVRSDRITAEELADVARLIGRKPFIWDNLYANDGPRQCKFLNLKPFDGRSASTLLAARGWALNPMNQSSLSKVAYLAALNVFSRKMDPKEAYDSAVEAIGGTSFKDYARAHASTFSNQSLDDFPENEKLTLRSAMILAQEAAPQSVDSPAQDTLDWLDGKYLVGPECLTD